MQHEMTTNTLAPSKIALSTLAVAAGCLFCAAGQAQNLPVTPAQKAVAAQVAQAGVPLTELAANAPDTYMVKSGDTLWAISGLFLKRPWRWPELWGMNLNDIRNPHRIYPGQQLFLERKNGRAMLRTITLTGGVASTGMFVPAGGFAVSSRRLEPSDTSGGPT